ncbi:MAG: 50S ribosomal protein L10, partial [Nitrospirota bacterium]
KIATENTPVSIAKDYFKGPVGIAISYDDPVLIARKIFEYSKKNEKLRVDSAIIEGSLCELDDIKAIGELPPRKVLLSMLAGVLKAPLNKFANALNETIANFAYAVEAVKTKKSVSE